MRWLGWMAVLLCAAQANAMEWQAGAGLTLRHAGEVDLADQASAGGYGSGSDTSPGQLGLQLTAGLRPLEAFEVGVDASIAVGGLSLGEVERRYLGSDPQPIGSSATVELGGALRYVPALGADTRLLLGAAGGWERMAASSPAGDARLDSAALGPEVGVRWRAARLGDSVDGDLQFRIDARWHLPTRVRVSRSQTDVLFEDASPADPFWSVGVSVTWLFGFR
jgi:hypothetical protein